MSMPEVIQKEIKGLKWGVSFLFVVIMGNFSVRLQKDDTEIPSYILPVIRTIMKISKSVLTSVPL